MNQLEQNNQPAKPPRKLTKKERGFVYDFVLTENGTQSALKHYDTKNYKTASVIASENLGKPRIQAAILEAQKTLKEALVESGITPEYIAGKVNVLLNATTKEGDEDYTAIDKGLKHATLIYGVKETEPPLTQNQTNYNFIFNQEAQKKIHLIEDELKLILTNNAQQNTKDMENE